MIEMDRSGETTLSDQLLERLKGKLIKQGAESRIYQASFCGKETIIKERFQKKYRHPVLDKEITDSRLTQEARCLVKSRKVGVAVPALYFVDYNLRCLFMEEIKGKTVRDYLYAVSSDTKCDFSSLSKNLARKIALCIASLHNAYIIHGDLTTSNMMLVPSQNTTNEANNNNDDDQLVLIDFGLSYTSGSIDEDCAVDMYVLERAFLSTHPNSEELFEEIMKYYGEYLKNGKQVLNKLEDVRMRGRKKLCFG